MREPLVSIIIPAKNEAGNVKMTVDAIINTPSSIPYEVIVIDDGSEDDCCRFLLNDERYWQRKSVRLMQTNGVGLPRAKNLGAGHAAGDILIFSDAHVLVEKDWLDKMVAIMADPGIDVLTPGVADYSNPTSVGFGQTWNENLEAKWLAAPPEVSPVPLAPGGFAAVKKEVFNRVGGFDWGFKLWGYEDVEFSFKCWLFGFSVFTTPNVTIAHVFRPRHTYYVSYDEVNYNLLRMALSHFNEARVAKTVALIKSMDNFSKTLTDCVFSDVWIQRQEFFSHRKFDDDWFMKRFQIPF